MSLIMMAPAIFGKDITSVLNYWAEIGVFSYVLPFLLVFAVVFGILSKVNILGEQDKNKGIHAVIAIAVGLLSLQWDIVPQFFGSIFPYAGVGIAILLVALILMGLFGTFDEKEGTSIRKIFLAIGAVIAFIVVISSLTNVGGWTAGVWWNEYGSALITLAIIATLVSFVVAGKKGETPKAPKTS